MKVEKPEEIDNVNSIKAGEFFECQGKYYIRTNIGTKSVDVETGNMSDDIQRTPIRIMNAKIVLLDN